MRQNGFISDREYALATEAPLTVAKGAAQSVEAPYFVDLVNDALQNRFQDAEFQANAFRVYTTLDMRAAARRRRSRPHRHAGGGRADPEAAALQAARRRPSRRWRWSRSTRTPAR